MTDAAFDYAKADAFGGVVINAVGEVLLREPAGHYGGYAWTFPKSRPKENEIPEHAALRSLLEEAGVRAAIRGPLPQIFQGTTSTTVFFLMREIEGGQSFSAETNAVRWVDVEEAKRLISLSPSKPGRKRDLAVLDAAFDLWQRHEHSDTSDDDWISAARRIIEMTAALHRRGLQKLRIMPYQYPIAYRIGVLPRALFSVHNGAWAPDAEGWYHCVNTSGNGSKVFGWIDAAENSAAELAEKFVRRFPEATAAGTGSDWAYAGWLVELLGIIDRTGRLPAVEAEHFTFGPYNSPGVPFIDYREGRPFEIGMKLPPPGEIEDDVQAFSRSSGSAMMDALELAALPGYLGSPSVVSELIGRIFKATIGLVGKEISYGDLHKEVDEVAKIFAFDSEDYARMPGWHSEDQLGAALIKFMGLDPEYHGGENLPYLLSEALIGLSLKIREILDAFNADPQAAWNPHGLQQLNQLHDFVTTVFLGTNTLAYPEATISDFVWKPVS